jgi:hydroxyproline O-galactosyltransferase 2/3/4/5/6
MASPFLVCSFCHRYDRVSLLDLASRNRSMHMADDTWVLGLTA